MKLLDLTTVCAYSATFGAVVSFCNLQYSETTIKEKCINLLAKEILKNMGNISEAASYILAEQKLIQIIDYPSVYSACEDFAVDCYWRHCVIFGINLMCVTILFMIIKAQRASSPELAIQGSEHSQVREDSRKRLHRQERFRRSDPRESGISDEEISSSSDEEPDDTSAACEASDLNSAGSTIDSKQQNLEFEQKRLADEWMAVRLRVQSTSNAYLSNADWRQKGMRWKKS